MKKIFLTLSIAFLCGISFAQNKVEAEKLVYEGIKYHDKEDYENAISKYDQALKLDKDNLFALVEMAYSLLAQKKYDETIKVSELALKVHKTGDELKTLYVTYGNALDMLDKATESIAAYDMGIKQFPNEQMLYFNKAITLRGLKRNSEALIALEKSILLKPDHPGSHNAISLILRDQGNYIGSLLACFRFFTLEPTSTRATNVLDRAKELMKAGVTKQGDKNINIVLPSGEKSKENTFQTAYTMLSMAAALDYGAEYNNETDVQRFKRKFDAICAALEVSQKENSGFLWSYYVPYFLELKAKGFSEIFANVAFASLKKPEITKYLQDNNPKLKIFAAWADAYQWKRN